MAEAILTINSGIDRLNANPKTRIKKKDEFNKKAGQGQGFINQAKGCQRTCWAH